MENHGVTPNPPKRSKTSKNHPQSPKPWGGARKLTRSEDCHAEVFASDPQIGSKGEHKCVVMGRGSFQGLQG